MKTVTRVIPNIEYNTYGQPIGPRRSLIRDIEKAAVGIAPYVAQQAYMEMYEDYAVGDSLATKYEIAPLGRKNDNNGRWLWEPYEGVLAEGFNLFINDALIPPGTIRASFGCPTQFFKHRWLDEMMVMPACDLQFDDLGANAPKLVSRIAKYMPDTLIVLETAPTDSVANPRLAKNFNFPKAAKKAPNVMYRVRASIVHWWITKYPTNNPLYNRKTPEKLSLYLPAVDCYDLDATMLKHVLPYFDEVTIQGQIPIEHLRTLVAWRKG